MPIVNSRWYSRETGEIAIVGIDELNMAVWYKTTANDVKRCDLFDFIVWKRFVEL